MSRRIAKIAGLVILGAIVAAGLFAVGRATADTHGARADGYASGHAAGYSAGYSAGLVAGGAQGRQEGRALQEGSALPSNAQQPVQDAFNAGYVAGVNDAFGGYDGGWALSAPYVITLVPGSGKIVYQFSSRTPMVPNVNYYLCPDGHSVCQQPRN